MNRDIDHFGIPSTGLMVKEDHELVQLDDCCLYILPSSTQIDSEQAKEHLNKLTCWNHFINQYDIEVLEELPCMCNHQKLEEAFKKDNYNLIMGMNEPGAGSGKRYLLVKSDESRLWSDVNKMIQVSEQMTLQSVQGLMLHHAMYAPDNFFWKTEHLWESDGFWKKYVTKKIEEYMGGWSFAKSPSISYLKKTLGLDKVMTHQKKIEIQERFIQDLIALKNDENDERAWAEVRIILDSLNINNQEVISYLTSMPDCEIEAFCNKVTPQKIAEQSNMKMEVRRIGKIDKKKTSDGMYRLFLLKEGRKDLQVHFKRHSSCILYLIYLIDITKSNSVDTLDINDNKYKDEFCRLFIKVYGYDGGLDYYNTMLSIGTGHSEQKILKHCLSDIRFAIGDACEALNEAASPYILNDVNSHLYIKKQNVIIDERLLATTAEM